MSFSIARSVFQISRDWPALLFVYLFVYVSQQLCPTNFKTNQGRFVLNPLRVNVCNTLSIYLIKFCGPNE